jgi:hypothetical protein
MSVSVPIELPLAGLNTLTPFLPFNSGYARELTNYAIANGNIEMRPGVSYTAANALITNRIMWYDGIASPAEVISGGNRINFSTGAVIAALSSYAFNRIPVEISYQGSTYLIGLGAPRAATSPFAVWSITTAGITATNITSACAHKGRLYVCDGSTIEYTGLGQVAGAIPATNTFPISQFLQNTPSNTTLFGTAETVLRMFSVTALAGNETSNVFVIFGTGGSVLVYTGDFPGDPNWELIGNFKMPAPINESSFVEINADIFVGTNQYCYWFRDLFTGDAQTAYDKRPSKFIDNIWQKVVWSWSTRNLPEISHFFYYAPLNAIICQCFDKGTLVRTAEYNNEACYFVYFIEYKAWALWLMAPIFAPYQSSGTGKTYLPYGISFFVPNYGFDDAQISGGAQNIYTSWKTPYLSPEGGRNKQLAGVKPFFFKEGGGTFELLQAIYDFTDYTQPFGFWNQPSAVGGLDPVNFTKGSISVASGGASKIYTEYCGLGGNGAGVSLQFTQKGDDSPSVREPQKIYKASLFLTEGANYPA